MSNSKHRILITGAAGIIGRSLLEGLRGKGKYDIVAADLHDDPQAGIVAMDVTDGERLKELMQGVQTVLHIAWAKDEEDFLGKVLPINVTGAYHVYEAARLNGVQRVVFASSNHATGFYPTGEDIEVDDPYRPDSFYGLSKCYIELLGRYYVDKYDLSSFNIRIGNFSGDAHPHSERSAHIWISPRDMVQLAQCCIEADSSMKYVNLYGTSANTDNYYDIGYLAQKIGYRPEDDAAELWEEAKRKGSPDKQDETEYQGGGYVAKDPKS
ncbi:NAD-dependent epimerase/dehydratase family protein [Paenibacillus taichungensis]